jgi:hypothetical protein
MEDIIMTRTIDEIIEEIGPENLVGMMIYASGNMKDVIAHELKNLKLHNEESWYPAIMPVVHNYEIYYSQHTVPAGKFEDYSGWLTFMYINTHEAKVREIVQIVQEGLTQENTNVNILQVPPQGPPNVPAPVPNPPVTLFPLKLQKDSDKEEQTSTLTFNK